MITAIVFVPPNKIEEAFDDLGEYIPSEFNPLFDWFEYIYIGRSNRRGNGRRAPLIPVEMWNLYNRVSQIFDRTNNHAEAAHRRIQAQLQLDHPTILKLIEGLKKVEKGRDTYYGKLVTGTVPPLKLRSYSS